MNIEIRKLIPELAKWINECIVCHSKGYKTAMPEHISRKFSVAENNLRRYFKQLSVDELRICEQCTRYTRQIL